MLAKYCYFVTFAQSQAACFPLFPVFLLSYDNQLLAAALADRFSH